MASWGRDVEFFRRHIHNIFRRRIHSVFVVTLTTFILLSHSLHLLLTSIRVIKFILDIRITIEMPTIGTEY